MRHRHALMPAQVSQGKGVKNPGTGPGLCGSLLLIRLGFADGLTALTRRHSD